MTFRSAISPALLALGALLSVNCTSGAGAPGSGSSRVAPVVSGSETEPASEGTRTIEQHPYVDSCAAAPAGYARCHAKRRIDVTNNAAPSGFGPADLASAYNLPPTGGAGMTVAIVDAQDDPNAEADLGVYRTQYGLPACTTANGCFKKVNQTGAASPLPAADGGWSQEIALDLDMVSAACPSCKIVLVEATSATDANLGTAVNTAVSLGANVVSNSYGGSESSSDPTTASTYYNHPGVLITVSSGDGAYGVEFPAAAPGVLSVGGTSLVKSTTARGWTETVWADAGSGCSKYETKPSWQADTGCAKRTVADVSAIGDPNTGVAVYETYASSDGGGGGWQVFGGTSVASPLVASIFALTSHASATPQYPYANKGFFYDVTSGSNGSCSSSVKYLCTGEVGYDGPTGNGTPDGLLMAGGTAPANDFSLAATSATESIAQGASGSDSITTAIASGAAETIALTASGAPSGVTVAFSPASVSSGAGSTMAITVGSSVAAGTYPITVTGTASSGAHTASVSLTVTSSAPPPPSDFTLGDTASITIAAGGSGTDSITTAIASGAAESIALSASGEPSGVTVAFSPTSVESGASSTMTVTVGSSVAAGTYAITIEGIAASGSHTVGASLTVTAAPPPPPAGLANGNFATGTFSGWTVSGGSSTVTSEFGVYGTNAYAAELGDYYDGVAGASTLAQTFTAPSGTSKLTLIWAGYCYGTGGEYFEATLKDDTTGKTTTFVPATCAARYAWRTVTAAVVAGHAYTLTLTNVDDDNGAFSLIGQATLK